MTWYSCVPLKNQGPCGACTSISCSHQSHFLIGSPNMYSVRCNYTLSSHTEDVWFGAFVGSCGFILNGIQISLKPRVSCIGGANHGNQSKFMWRLQYLTLIRAAWKIKVSESHRQTSKFTANLVEF